MQEQDRVMKDQKIFLDERAKMIEKADNVNAELTMNIEKLQSDMNAFKKLRSQIKTVLGDREENLSEAIEEATSIFRTTQTVLDKVMKSQSQMKMVEKRTLSMMSKMKLEGLKNLLMDMEFGDGSPGFSEDEFKELEYRIEEKLQPYWKEIVVSWMHQLALSTNNVTKSDNEEKTLDLERLRDLINQVFELWTSQKVQNLTKQSIIGNGTVKQQFDRNRVEENKAEDEADK